MNRIDPDKFPVPAEPLFDESATPSQKPDVDIDSISETPSTDDYYLYSRIDGSQTVGDLCTTSGLGKKATIEGLRRLLDLGLIDIPGADAGTESSGRNNGREDAGDDPNGLAGASVVSDVSETSSLVEDSSSSPVLGARASSSVESDSTSSSSMTRSTSSVSRASSSTSESTGATSSAAEAEDSSKTGIDLTHLPVPPSQFDYDSELLKLDVPLSEELKRELLVLDEQVDELTHYQFFGVERDAPHGAIKKSYFKLSKRYHPDKHFRKEIGPYKEMLENVFQKITRAYRTLSNADQREEYDRELTERQARQSDPGASIPTPMSTPSEVHMAKESASSRAADASTVGTDKRTAAFAKLVKKAESCRKRADFDRAAELYRKALSLKRDLKVALQATRVLLNADAQLDQAALFARAALEIDEEHLEARMMLGRTFERRGEPDKAVEQYDRVLELEPDHDKAKTRRKRLVRN